MNYRVLIVLLLVAPLALAHVIGQSHLHWLHDGVDTNGDPTVLTQFTIYCDKDDGSESVTYPVLDPTATSATTSEMGLSDGAWTCTMTATNAFAESARSEPLSFFLSNGVRVNPVAPAAPYAFTIEVK